ncbi:MAG: HAMP domain-containing protein, partial [Alphaproteobacteria bacterium]
MTSPAPNGASAPAAISHHPAAKWRALGIASKIWFALGVLVALSVVSAAAVYLSLADIGRHLNHMSSATQPVSAAAYEMEINAIGTGMGVLKYLHRADPTHRERFEKDQADFERFQRLYRERVWNDEARRLGEQARQVYEGFNAVGRRLIAAKDRQVAAVRRFSEIVHEISLLIDDDLRAAIDPNSPRAWERVALGKKMRSELAEIGLLLAGYLLGASDPAAVREIREEAHGFRQAVQKRADLATTPAEGAWVRDIASAFDRLAPIIDETIDIDRDTDTLLIEFVALRTRLDVLLDDEIQIMARAELERSEELVRASTGNATATLAVLALLGLVLAVLVAYRLSRSVIAPIRALAEGTERLKHGDWTHRIFVRQRDELGDLARAFNAMAATVSEKQGELESANMDLEARVVQRTQRLDETNYQLTVRLEAQRAAEAALRETK